MSSGFFIGDHFKSFPLFGPEEEFEMACNV